MSNGMLADGLIGKLSCACYGAHDHYPKRKQLCHPQLAFTVDVNYLSLSDGGGRL